MTETELEELEALLSSVEGGSASLPVDGLHGFLSALVMSGGDTRAEPLLPWILSPMPGSPLDLDHVPQARRVGELVSVHVIPRPHDELEGILPTLDN